MRDNPYKLILCDLGNVLINFDHRLAVRRILAHTDKSFQELYDIFFDSPITKDYEEGRSSSAEFFQQLCFAMNLKSLTFDAFASIWNEIFFDSEGMLELLSSLKKNYRLHLVSNINELHYNYIVSKFPSHLKVFDKIILSYEVGRRKPHTLIYQAAIAETGFEPGEVLYIDDRDDLVHEAAKLGIQSVVFKGVESLRQELKKLGVIFG